MNEFDVENTPLVTLLNDLLNEYTAKLRSLLGQFDTEGNRNTAATTTASRAALTESLIPLDQNLQQLYKELQMHQQRQQEIRNTQALTLRSNQAKHKFINSLLEAQMELESLKSDADKRIDRAQRAQLREPQISEIIEYASKLSKFTMAPPNYNPESNDPESIIPAEPPYPVLVAMRAGILNRYRTKKTARDSQEEEDDGGAEFAHNVEADEFDDVDADDLLLGLDLNPDLE
ncbi:hypothetical protein LPJ68_000614 [Coemansia sp. RSA 1086]|nr:hypothetical protein LPJ68_000614 [Coemansia sp. RSA 1086]